MCKLRTLFKHKHGRRRKYAQTKKTLFQRVLLSLDVRHKVYSIYTALIAITYGFLIRTLTSLMLGRYDCYLDRRVNFMTPFPFTTSLSHTKLVKTSLLFT